MRIAIVYDNGEIGAHFGHADCIAVYDYDLSDLSKCTKTLIDTTEVNGHNNMIKVVKDEGAEVLMAQTMGQEAISGLLANAIIPIAGYCGDADTAAELIVTGQLPLFPSEEGGCGGGCGGCGGSCGGDEGGSCGCGGGCCH